jgi:hypothetical protein
MTDGMFYTGVGSRRAPLPVLVLVEGIARRLAANGWTLRSGRAPGMDQAFELGAGRDARIFLPEPWFEARFESEAAVTYERPTPEAYELAERLHPCWAACGRFARACHARNCHQVLGLTLDSPSRFLLCWTPGGREVGGTAQAIRVAQAHDVPVINLGREQDVEPDGILQALRVTG